MTKREAQAAQLVAEDALTDAQIAEDVGIHLATLERWKRRPDFRARVAELVAEYRERLKAEGLANKQNRLAALTADFEATEQIKRERAEAHDGEAPGGGSGLLVRREKQIGAGPNAVVVTEWAFDASLVGRRIDLIGEAAKEVADRTEKVRHEVTGKDGGPIKTEDVGLTDAQRVARLVALLDEARARRGDTPAGGPAAT